MLDVIPVSGPQRTRYCRAHTILRQRIVSRHPDREEGKVIYHTQAAIDARKRSVELAKALLAGDVEFVDGIRRLYASLLNTGDRHEDSSSAIAGIRSETDQVIIGEGRKEWATEYLERTDRLVNDYIPKIRDTVFDACRSIIDRYENDSYTVTLYRPVGPEEFKLIEESCYAAFPPRLPDQPIFYPVLGQQYAEEIASKWNVAESGAGYVTRFQVRRNFLDGYTVHQVGNRTHLEYWIPADELAQLNANIVGTISVVKAFDKDSS